MGCLTSGAVVLGLSVGLAEGGVSGGVETSSVRPGAILERKVGEATRRRFCTVDEPA